MAKTTHSIRVASEFQEMFQYIGFTPEMVFKHPDIKPWRKLPDRENCVWDLKQPDGKMLRIHVKRYPPVKSPKEVRTPADQEAAGFRMLERCEIPTAKLIAWGTWTRRQSFVLIEDLAGYQAADVLIKSGVSFAKLLEPTADLAAHLHNSRLHHCDLYLCHFFAKIDRDEIDVRLIDVARVDRLPGLINRRRWIVKDLAQFIFSTRALPITDAQRDAWLNRYIEKTKIARPDALRRSIRRKADSIAAHDVSLRAKQPNRNISIPK